MKNIYLSIIAVLIVFLASCAHFPTETRYVQIGNNYTNTEILEIIIDVGRDMKFPSMTKLDKSNGIVEFGDYGTAVTGITAQVRITTKDKLEVTVIRGSVYVQLPVKDVADEFKRKLEFRMKN